VKRREFIAGLCGGAAWSVAARAQQRTLPVIGFLNSGSPGGAAHLAGAFRQGLDESGYVEQRNVASEYRWAAAENDRLPVLANNLVRAQVSAIFAGGPPAALAAKAATTTIPIIFISGEDPVKMGLVASFNRPGGNVTGIAMLLETLGPKRLALVRELMPTSAVIAALLDPSLPTFETQLTDIQQAARSVGQQIQILRASNKREIETAIATASARRPGAMLVGPSFLYSSLRNELVALAAGAAIPTIYHEPEFVSAGGLMSYGASTPEAYRQAGSYVAKILKGEKPSNLPVVQPTKFDLAINLKTARALGLTVPNTLLALADEVIE
jgi:putative tryptophan/tyrosine transport system substrate-binding protein